MPGNSLLLPLKCARITWASREYFEVNIRSVVAFREIGRGRDAANKFFCIANMNRLNNTSFDNINNTLKRSKQS